jgi:hypothetical protein
VKSLGMAMVIIKNQPAIGGWKTSNRILGFSLLLVDRVLNHGTEWGSLFSTPQWWLFCEIPVPGYGSLIFEATNMWPCSTFMKATLPAINGSVFQMVKSTIFGCEFSESEFLPSWRFDPPLKWSNSPYLSQSNFNFNDQIHIFWM